MWGGLYAIFSIGCATLVTVQLLFLQNLINRIAEYSPQLSVMPVIVAVLLYVFSFVLQVLINYIIVRLDIKVSIHLMSDMSKKLVEKINRIDYSCFEDEQLYNIIQRMGENPHDSIKEVFISSLNTLNAFIILLGVSIIFLQVSYILAFSLLFVLVGVVLCSTKGMGILNSTIRQQTKDERFLNYYNSLLLDKNSILELKIFNAIPLILDLRIEKEKTVLKKLFVRFIKADIIYSLSTILIIAWVMIALFLVGGAVVTQQVTIGVFVIVVQAAVAIVGHVETLAYSFSETVNSVEMVRYYKLFMDFPERSTNVKDLYAPDAEKDVVFRNVYFSYPGTENYVLENISLSFNMNEKIAIVGANGAGKSTLIKLLLNLYKPNKGSIKIKLKAISPVFQDYACYFLSLKENVALGDVKNIEDDAKINEALIRGQMMEFVNDLPQKLETTLGKLTDNGVDLSDGQWQRLAISRGVFSTDSFVILDEPTASMDPIAESQMYTHFLDTLKMSGAIIISHRLASAKLADKIFVLESGEIVEQGTHNDLMNSEGVYYKMFELQSSWYSDEK